MRKPQDDERFAAVMLAFSELHNRVPSMALVDMYWRALERYDIDAIERAAAAVMADPDTGQYWPKPADFVRHIDGGKADSALVAWSLVDRAVRQVGPYASVVFDDSITMAVLSDMGGWIPLANKTEADWPFVAREFENRYRGYRVRSAEFTHPAVLLGMTDLENVRRGLPAMAPVYIGNQAKCLKVQSTGGQAARLDANSGEIAQSLMARIASSPKKGREQAK